MSINKSQTENLASILKGNKFVIPTYQRKYSWTESERLALWKDIEESIKDDMNHFIGTLSFKQNKAVGLSSEMSYEVIDGQQRLTTIFILLSSLIDNVENDAVKVILRNDFIGNIENIKLEPLGNDGDFLKRVIFDFDGIKPSTINKRSQKLLYASKKEFISFIKPLTQVQVEERIIFIRDRMEVLVFNVESQAQAVKMFSIINDRGLPLRILDKTKSILMLYSTIHLSEKLNELINDSFEHIFDSYDDILVSKERLGILSRFEENTIFTHHYYSARRLFRGIWNNRDGAEKIFDNLKISCDEAKSDIEKLESFIKEYLIDFKLFAISYAKLVKEVEKNTSYHKPFIFLEFTATLYPLIVRLYMQEKLNSVLSILESIELRVYKLRGTNPVADIYWLSSYVAEWDIPVDDIVNRLFNFNEKFMNDYNFKNYLNINLYGNGGIKYILSEYQREILDVEAYKNLQVEHIFSKDPNFEPNEYGFDEDYGYEKNRIGNLTLLEQGLNIGIGNVAPIHKVLGYLNSAIKETRDIGGEIQLGGFNKLNVDRRGERIIDYCLERYRINTGHSGLHTLQDDLTVDYIDEV